TKGAIPALIFRAEDPTSFEIRRLCVATLRRAAAHQPDMRVVNALMKAAHDATAHVRMEAAIGLGAIGLPSDPVDVGRVERVLVTLARDRDKVVGLWAQVSQLALSPKLSDEKISAIARYLDNPEARVRVNAARALGVMGAKARHCVPSLVK